MQEEFRGREKKLYMCFVDLEKAFDGVPRKVMEWALRKKSLPEVLVKAVMSLYDGLRTKVRVGSGLSEEFGVRVGVHQGSVISPLIFAIVVDAVTEQARKGILNEILYADDLVLMSENLEDLRKRFQRWRGALESKGMKVNIRKTKMQVSGAEGEIVRSKVDPCGICGKRVLSSAQCVRNGFTLDVPKRKKYPAVLRNSFSAEDVKVLETARKNQWRCCVMRWRLRRVFVILELG